MRTVHYFNISRSGELIECRVCADGFLYNMVRAMVGTCVYAADGKFSPDDVPAILEGRNRTAAGPTVPGRGALYGPNCGIRRTSYSSLSCPYVNSGGISMPAALWFAIGAAILCAITSVYLGTKK